MEQYQKREWLSDEEFKARYQREDWRQLSRAAKKRDGYKCRVCGKGGKLAVHHAPEAYAMFGNERLEDLVTLCWKCHPKGNYSKFKIKQDRWASIELKVLFAAGRGLKIAALWLWWLIRWTVKLLGYLLLFLFMAVVFVFAIFAAIPAIIRHGPKKLKKEMAKGFWALFLKGFKVFERN